MNKKNLLLPFLLMVGYAFSQKNVGNDIYSGYVRYESSAAAGTITVVSTGFGKKNAESIQDSFKEAFYTLLFRGIAGSPYELPMIPNESEKKNDPAIIALLGEGYSSFVTASSLQSEDKKVKGKGGAKGVMTVNRITINCDALRRHLEQTKVIRKFGI